MEELTAIRANERLISMMNEEVNDLRGENG